MTSLLTKDALSKLPADLRDHIIVENENLYGLTLHMGIGDFERLVAPHHLLDQYRERMDELAREVTYYEQAADDAEAEAEDARCERDAIAAAVQTYLGLLDIDHPSDSPQAVALAALEDLL